MYERKMLPASEPRFRAEFSKRIAGLVAPMKDEQVNWHIEFAFGIPGHQFACCKAFFLGIWGFSTRWLTNLIRELKDGNTIAQEPVSRGAVSTDVTARTIVLASKMGISLTKADIAITKIPDTHLQHALHAYLKHVLTLMSDTVPNRYDTFHVAAVDHNAVYAVYVAVRDALLRIC